MYHWTPPKNDAAGNALSLLRHTPRERQRLYMYYPLIVDAEALVMPEIFNTQYLQLDNYQAVDWWQSPDGGMDINITPAIVDTATGEQKAGDPVETKVVALLTDVDGLMTNFQLEAVNTTPLEARKLYRNVWHTFLRNNMNDNTENAILYIMEDPTP